MDVYLKLTPANNLQDVLVMDYPLQKIVRPIAKELYSIHLLTSKQNRLQLYLSPKVTNC
jgi:hypothetical protein